MALQEHDIAVRCIAENFMSMAFILFEACDERLVLPHSIEMQHQMSFSLGGEIESMRTSVSGFREKRTTRKLRTTGGLWVMIM